MGTPAAARTRWPDSCHRCDGVLRGLPTWRGSRLGGILPEAGGYESVRGHRRDNPQGAARPGVVQLVNSDAWSLPPSRLSALEETSRAPTRQNSVSDPCV